MSFFYAKESAHNYDSQVEMTSEHYVLAHQTLSKLIELNFSGPGVCNLTDLGSGTGAVFFHLINKYEQINMKAFDISSEMLGIFKQKIEEAGLESSNTKKVSYVLGDVRNTPLLRKTLSRVGQLGVTSVTSAFMLHHFHPVVKMQIYKAIADNLNKGEKFFLLDLFDYHDSEFSKFALDVELDWIRKNFNGVASANTQEKESILAERDKWLNHLISENQLVPIGWQKGQSSISEEELLTNAGFSKVNCCFKYFQTAILVGEK